MAYVPDEADKRCEEISGKAWKLYTLYCRFANKKGVAWPSLETIARERNWTKPNACKARKELVSEGWVSIIEGDKVQLEIGFEHFQNGNETVSKMEMHRFQNGNADFQNGNADFQNGNETVSKMEMPCKEEPAHIEPAQLTSPLEPARTRDDGATLSDALLELFPHLESLNKNAERQMRECVSLCLRLKVTPDKVPKWRGWLVSKWPLANVRPEKFLETLNQFLQEECSDGSSTGHYELAPTNSARPGLSAAERRRLNQLEIEAYFLDTEPEALART